MSTTTNLLSAADRTEAYLQSAIDQHRIRLLSSITDLEMRIVDRLSDFKTSGGRLLGPQANLKLAQKIHRDLDDLINDTYGDTTRFIVKDFQRSLKYIDEELSAFGDAASFTGVDKDMVSVLQNSTWSTFKQLGDAQRELMIDGMYGAIVGGTPFSELVSGFQKALSGGVDKAGRSLARYSTTYANDAIMNFHREVHLMKANKLKIDSFLYYGNTMITTRPFCKDRVMQVFTREEIQSWTFDWKGKSGPAMDNCGGYNCRHRWVAVRPEEIDEEKIKELIPSDAKPLKPPVKEAVTKPPKPAPVKPRAKTLTPEQEYKQALKDFKKGTKGTGLGSWKYAKRYGDVENNISILNPVATPQGREKLREKAQEYYNIHKLHENVLDKRALWMDSLSPENLVIERKQIMTNWIKADKSVPDGKLISEFLDEKYGNGTYATFINQLEKGTQYLPNRLFLELDRANVNVKLIYPPKRVPGRFLDNKGGVREFFQTYDGSVNLGPFTSSTTVSHEFAHAVDSILSGYRSGKLFNTTGFMWDSFDDELLKIRNNVRSIYKSKFQNGLGTYTNGDGKYYKGNWISNYEGRIYGNPDVGYAAPIPGGGIEKIQQMGEEFWSMNCQRYAEGYSFAVRNFASERNKILQSISRVNRDIANLEGPPGKNANILKRLTDEKSVLERDLSSVKFDDFWEKEKRYNIDLAKMRRHYPGLLEELDTFFDRWRR